MVLTVYGTPGRVEVACVSSVVACVETSELGYPEKYCVDLCEPPRHRTDAVAATRSLDGLKTPAIEQTPLAATQLRRQHRVDGGRPKFDFHTSTGEVPREAPNELDARRVGGPAQERDLGVEGRGAERAEVRSDVCSFPRARAPPGGSATPRRRSATAPSASLPSTSLPSSPARASSSGGGGGGAGGGAASRRWASISDGGKKGAASGFLGGATGRLRSATASRALERLRARPPGRVRGHPDAAAPRGREHAVGAAAPPPRRRGPRRPG